MKALLLAAGRGTRISRYLNGNPKCTVDLGNGKPLIINTVEMLHNKGIDEIAIVTGYRSSVLQDLLKDYKVTTFFNPFFDVTNSIASAWFASSFLDDDILIMNADVFCEEKLYDLMLDTPDDPVMFYDTTRCKEADYKFLCENGTIKKYGKELTEEETSGEYVGIAKISRKFLPIFTKRLEQLIEQQQHGVWWENVLYSMTGEMPIYVRDVAPYFWAEVDYIEDYERIQQFVHAQKE